MKKINIYTDGACSGNPGPGGWGTILRFGKTEKELHGGEDHTTNNRMELMAVIQGLMALKEKCDVTIYTDSKYVMDGVEKWLEGWKAKNWRTASKKPVKNVDLWQEIDQLLSQHKTAWQWVKGHSGHIENERADALARKYYEENHK